MSEIALGWSTVFALSMVLMFAVGFGAILMAATVNTTIQLAVPDGLRGRVMSVYTTIFAGSTPIGGPVMGGIASLFGIAISLAVGGVLSLAVGGGALAWLRRSGQDRIPRQSVARATASTAVSTATGPAAIRGRVPGVDPPALTGALPGQPAGCAEHERRVEPAEPERGRQHAPVGAVASARAAGPGSSVRDLGIRLSRLTDAGAQPSRMASAQIAASMAPEAPSGCPYRAFVPLTGTVAARSPSASAIARASATSPIGVDEAWALT